MLIFSDNIVLLKQNKRANQPYFRAFVYTDSETNKQTEARFLLN